MPVFSTTTCDDASGAEGETTTGGGVDDESGDGETEDTGPVDGDDRGRSVDGDREAAAVGVAELRSAVPVAALPVAAQPARRSVDKAVATTARGCVLMPMTRGAHAMGCSVAEGLSAAGITVPNVPVLLFCRRDGRCRSAIFD